MAFCLRADDGLLIVVFGSSLPSSTKKKVGPSLTKLAEPAHVCADSPEPFLRDTDNVISTNILLAGPFHVIHHLGQIIITG